MISSRAKKRRVGSIVALFQHPPASHNSLHAHVELNCFKFEMASSFTYGQECCFCSKRFKTLRAVEKHTDTKHPEKILSIRSIRFWDSQEQSVSIPDFKCMDRRSKDYKEGYLSWLAGLTEQMNASLHPCLRG